MAAVDTVREYRSMAERLREQELQRALRALNRGDDPEQVLAQLARALTNKLIHAPTAGLKRASVDGRQDLLTSARRLLGLENEAAGGSATPVRSSSVQAAAAPGEAGPAGDELAAPRPTHTLTGKRTLQ